MTWRSNEPTLADILSDSVTRALMRADGIDRSELASMLEGIGRELATDVRSGGAPGTPCL